MNILVMGGCAALVAMGGMVAIAYGLAIIIALLAGVR